jgi:hypothetical protein
MSERRDDVAARVSARRERFRGAVERLSERAHSTQLLRMLVLPGAFLLLAGFVLMFLGWYGAAHTARQIEQIPYLISGGFVGLGLVFVGALTLACALWMSMLQRFAAEQRAQQHEEPAPPKPAATRARRRTRSTRP